MSSSGMHEFHECRLVQRRELLRGRQSVDDRQHDRQDDLELDDFGFRERRRGRQAQFGRLDGPTASSRPSLDMDAKSVPDAMVRGYLRHSEGQVQTGHACSKVRKANITD